jgi:hypothetical protein
MIKIKLNGKSNLYTKISECDQRRVEKFKWYASVHHGGHIYVKRWDGELLHRYILKAKKGETIDHLDGDGLNNTRENIRKLEQRTNLFRKRYSGENSTGYRGVSKSLNKFCATIGYKGSKIYLGTFDTAREAHEAYKKAAKVLHKDETWL